MTDRDRALGGWVSYGVVVALVGALVCAGVWSLGASIVGHQHARPRSRATVRSGDASSGALRGSASFSCAPPFGEPARGVRVVETARIGSSSATLSGTVWLDPGELVLKHPIVTLRDRNSPPTSAPLFRDDPTDLAEVGIGTGHWSPDADYRLSAICIAESARHDPVALVAVASSLCNACNVDVELFAAVDGHLERMATRTVGIAPAGLFTSREGPVLIGRDYSFQCDLTDCAQSSLPVRVYALDSGGIHDVTRSWPDVLERDAASQWAYIKEEQRTSDYDLRGYLGAWAADECELGHCRRAFDTIVELTRRERLEDLWPETKAQQTSELHEYLHQLRQMLVADGSIRPGETS